MKKSELAEQYCAKFPNTATHALAKVMYSENSVMFKDAEDARYTIRYVRGSTGVVHKKHRANKQEFFKDESELNNPFFLAPTDSMEFSPYVLPEENNKILVLSDIHFPYHDPIALNCALEYGEYKEVNTIVLNGDILDAYQLSHFMKDPRERHFKYEIDMLREFLEMLKAMFPGTKIIFKIGNHSERYEHYLMTKAPELLGIEQFRLENITGCDELGIDVVNDKRIIKAGKLNIVHGHEFGRSVFNPVNAARGLYMRGRENILAGHFHATSEHTEPDINGKYIACWSTGCLCGLHPKYRPINKWNQGFAYVKVKEGGMFNVDNKKILNGKIL